MSLSRQFTRREKVLMGILAVLVLIALYLFLVDRPVKAQLESIQTQSDDLELQIIVLQATNERIQQMQAELDAVMSQPNTAAIPKYDNLEQVMAFLDTVLASSDEYNLSFEGISADEDSTILRRTMSLSFRCGSYELARAMVVKLQDCPYRCLMGNLNMTAILPEGVPAESAPPLDQAALSVSLTMTFYESN